MTEYCCPMRRHFLIGIIGIRQGEPTPVEAADYVIAWEPKVLIRIKHCPFCGKLLDGNQPVRTMT